MIGNVHGGGGSDYNPDLTGRTEAARVERIMAARRAQTAAVAKIAAVYLDAPRRSDLATAARARKVNFCYRMCLLAVVAITALVVLVPLVAVAVARW